MVPILRELALSYPEELVEKHLSFVERTAFDISLVIDRVGARGTVCDLGGGFGLFAMGCARLGMSAILADDFHDLGALRTGRSIFKLFEAEGVEVIDRDLIADGLTFPAGSLDAVTSFHSMEHWHNSPKALFASMSSALTQGGLFVLAGPNCVNLRKRITTPLGHGKWSQMADWYETTPFRGHVREPDVRDLLYIVDDMRLVEPEILGRNFLGYRSQLRLTRRLTRIADKPLRRFPSLCSDIYVAARKPPGPNA